MKLKLVHLRKWVLNVGYQWWTILALLILFSVPGTVSRLQLPDEQVFADVRTGARWTLAVQLILTIGFLALALRRWRVDTRRVRVTAGLCGRCGYDLRASADCCPECGEPIDREKTSWLG